MLSSCNFNVPCPVLSVMAQFHLVYLSVTINQPTMYPIKELKNNWLTNFPVIYSKKI